MQILFINSAYVSAHIINLDPHSNPYRTGQCFRKIKLIKQIELEFFQLQIFANRSSALKSIVHRIESIQNGKLSLAELAAVDASHYRHRRRHLFTVFHLVLGKAEKTTANSGVRLDLQAKVLFSSSRSLVHSVLQ